MVRLKSPLGIVVEASEDVAKALEASGYVRVKPAAKPTTRKKRTTK